MQHNEEFNNKYGKIALNSEESQILDDWVARFEQKYPKVGRLIQ